MGIGEILIAAKEIYEIIKIVKEILKELDIDQKDVKNALNSLKEVCEGTLVEAIDTVVDGLTTACKELIDNFTQLFDILDRDVKEIETSDSEGSKLLKEALHM